MRILFVTLFFPPARTAGTENYTRAVAAELAARGHDVSVVCAGGWETGRGYLNGVTECRDGAVTVHRLHLNWTRAWDPNRALFDSARVERWFERFARGLSPDIVHTTSLITLGLGVVRAGRRLGIPQVLTLMDFWMICPRTSLLRADGALCGGDVGASDCARCLLADSKLDRRLSSWLPGGAREVLWRGISKLPPLSRMRGARGMALDMVRRREAVQEALELPDVILSHSRFVQRTFAGVGLSGRVRLLPLGHDLGWLQDREGREASPVLRLAYLGQLTSIKGVHVAIEGFRRADLGHAARLDIWGDPGTDPQYAAALRHLIGHSTNIVLRGSFRRDSLGEVLARADAVIVPSLWYENAPLVIQESFAAGVPVIATNLGGMAEAVTHEVNGLLFQRNDADDLARLLRRVLDEPDLLPRLVRGVPKVRTVAQEIDELEGVYRELTSVGESAGAGRHAVQSDGAAVRGSHTAAG